MIQSARGAEQRDVWANNDGKFGEHSEPRRVMLLVAIAGTVSERLIHALSREFPWIETQQVETVGAACTAFAHPVSLILVDASLLKAAEDASTEFFRMHPQALTAVIEPDGYSHPSALPDIFESQLVRGILPMNLRLDVWLSVIRLMLCGGEYYPPAAVRSWMKRNASHMAATPRTAQAVNGSDLSSLTAREIQILEMVSRGLQNKTIASEFDLSEHTVKIHLHNIISKLGAHNRTEAAAKFRNFQMHGPATATSQFPSSIETRRLRPELATLGEGRNKA
ncbi:response regulator transcription factor [Mesorhizobium sp. CN2-181]|uniref:helix-turn-helix transcriptional regulator n=1 Tax=Mesorhizobium yinganensis TaxID=3157707 RepID=UPI0032B85A6A